MDQFLVKEEAGQPNPAPSFSSRAATGLKVALSSVVRDRRVIALSILTTLGLAIALAFVIKPKYVASSSVLVLLSQEYSPHAAGEAARSSSIVLERDAVLKNEVEILQSRSLQKATLQRIGLAKVFPDLSRKGPLGQIIDVFRTTTRGLFTLLHIPVAPEADPLEVGVNEFAKNFFVTPDKTGNVIFVTFSNGDPALAAEVVNALVKTYIEKRALLFRDVQSATMNEQVESLKNKLAKAQKEYADFKTKNDISDYAVQRNILLHQRAQISDDLQAANRSISEAAARIDVTEKFAGGAAI